MTFGKQKSYKATDICRPLSVKIDFSGPQKLQILERASFESEHAVDSDSEAPSPLNSTILSSKSYRRPDYKYQRSSKIAVLVRERIEIKNVTE